MNLPSCLKTSTKALFLLFCFNTPYQFTSLLNLHSLIFHVTPFGWIISIHLSLSCLWKYHFQFTATFSRTQLQHKTRPFCTVWLSLHSDTQSLGFLQSKWPNALSSDYKKRASKQAKQANKHNTTQITY